MPASAFAREYENVFDSLEARFFDADVIAAAFGGVMAATPPQPDGDPDPIISRAPAFAPGGLPLRQAQDRGFMMSLNNDYGEYSRPIRRHGAGPPRRCSSASMSGCTPTTPRLF